MGKIPKTYNGWEAYGYLFSSLWYLIKHPQYGAILYALAGFTGWNEISHLTDITIVFGEKAKTTKIDEMEEERPHSSILDMEGGAFSVPVAFAQDKKSARSWKSENAIVIGRELYGFQDTRFKLYKKEGADEILVYYAPNNFGRWVEASPGTFDPDKFK